MWLEVLGFTVGILYLWWEYNADRKVWLASVVMPAISMWLYFSKGLYADFAINIYYLVIAVYGFMSWSRKGKVKEGKSEDSDDNDKGGNLQIIHVPRMVWVGIVLVAVVLWGFIWWILTRFTDSTVPVADAFTTALSIVGLWMLARKYAEQWLVWLVVDIVCSALYWYKGLPLYCILYAVYTVIAWFGYRKWLKLMRENTLRKSMDPRIHAGGTNDG